jgi:hypothetical protein
MPLITLFQAASNNNVHSPACLREAWRIPIWCYRRSTSGSLQRIKPIVWLLGLDLTYIPYRARYETGRCMQLGKFQIAAPSGNCRFSILAKQARIEVTVSKVVLPGLQFHFELAYTRLLTTCSKDPSLCVTAQPPHSQYGIFADFNGACQYVQFRSSLSEAKNDFSLQNRLGPWPNNITC